MLRTRSLYSAGLCTAFLLCAGALAAPEGYTPPQTPKNAVTDEYHGVKVVDEYRWLENAEDPAVKDWSDAQNAAARSVLDKIACVPDVRVRVSELERNASVEYHDLHYAAGRYFFSKSQPPLQQPLIVVLSSLGDTKSEKVILDPNKLDPTGGTSFDWFAPSPDGTMVAVSLSKGGSESGDVHVFNVETGEAQQADMVGRVNGGTAGGSLAWTRDSKGFFYTRYPRDGERPQEDMDFYTQVYFHELGGKGQDKYICGKDYPKIAEIMIETSPASYPGGEWALVNTQNGDGGEFIQDIIAPEGKVTRLSKWDDRIVEAKFGPAGDNAIYLVSRKNAPNGKVLRLALGAGELSLGSAKEVVAEKSDASIQTSFAERTGLYSTKTRLYVLYQIGGPNALRAFSLEGKALGVVPQPEISTIEGVEPLEGDDLAFGVDSFVTPPAWHTLKAGFEGEVGSLAKTALAVPNPPGMPELKVVREFAVSKDGTKVPVNIVMRADLKPDGKTPTLVWGYGGYGVCETPGFSRRRLVWLEQGCIFALANIRGGGEYGERWHLEGNLTKKQNVFDDFTASCKHMIDKGYTTREKLAIVGGSNGGLLMGATFTQNPDLCKAVVSSVGIYDMLRVELSANGAFNITEFGTVKDKDQFKALYAYSPYHHVKDGTRYPAVLFMTGANDPRVDPMQSRKMTARLQAADPKGLFVLRTSGNTGHGIGTPLSERIEQTVDQYSFLFDQLGVEYRPVANAK